MSDDEPAEFAESQQCGPCGATAHRSPTVVRYGKSLGTCYTCERCGESVGAVFPHPADPASTHAFIGRRVRNLTLNARPLEAAR